MAQVPLLIKVYYMEIVMRIKFQLILALIGFIFVLKL